MQPLLPLLPHHQAIAQIAIQERFVAVGDQPPMHLIGQPASPLTWLMNTATSRVHGEVGCGHRSELASTCPAPASFPPS